MFNYFIQQQQQLTNGEEQFHMLVCFINWSILNLIEFILLFIFVHSLIIISMLYELFWLCLLLFETWVSDENWLICHFLSLIHFRSFSLFFSFFTFLFNWLIFDKVRLVRWTLNHFYMYVLFAHFQQRSSTLIFFVFFLLFTWKQIPPFHLILIWFDSIFDLFV